MIANTHNNLHKPVESTVKVVPLGDEINRLQTRLGGLRRQTGHLTDNPQRVNASMRLNNQG